MRKLLLATVILLLANGLKGQSLCHEITQNIRCSAGSDMAYPGSTQLQMTPPPEGWKPFYISHFGRHGSCFLDHAESYDIPYRILEAADSLGKLTSLGHDVLRRLDCIRHDVYDRWGELTELGAYQQQQIVRRMVNRFPKVFADGTTVDARSSTKLPCVLSMEHAMSQLAEIRPSVEINHNASKRDMSYLDLSDRQLSALQADTSMQAALTALAQKCQHSKRLMDALFNDADYVRNHVDADKLYDGLFRVASNIQNTEMRKSLTLYDLFSDEEVCCSWKKENARTYCTYSPHARTAVPLLRKMIAQADSYILQHKHGAHLRYGYEHVLLPLLFLLDIKGCGINVSDPDAIDKKGWADFKLCPMAANIQFVFYAPNLAPSQVQRFDDVLVKVLLNEIEVKLPLKTMLLPYYHWSDVRDYYLKKLDAYEE